MTQMYKSISIRDARQSLQLNTSLWRISWLTFIFLPLTFLASFFGMNVSELHNNPSMKWYVHRVSTGISAERSCRYFIVAAPLVGSNQVLTLEGALTSLDVYHLSLLASGQDTSAHFSLIRYKVLNFRLGGPHHTLYSYLCVRPACPRANGPMYLPETVGRPVWTSVKVGRRSTTINCQYSRIQRPGSRGVEIFAYHPWHAHIIVRVAILA